VRYPKVLGEDPATGRKVVLLRGPYGAYLQLEAGAQLTHEARAAANDAELLAAAAAHSAETLDIHAITEAGYAALTQGQETDTTRPPRVRASSHHPPKESTTKFGLQGANIRAEDVTLELALDLLRYPMVLGLHPEDSGEVTMHAGAFGWYVSHQGFNATLPKKTLRAARDAAVAASRSEADRKGSKREAGASAFAFTEGEKLTLTEEEFMYTGAAGDDGEEDGVEGAERGASRTGKTRKGLSDAWYVGSEKGQMEGYGLSLEARATLLRAQHSPVSLEAAVEVLTKKKLKLAFERERSGNKKQAAKVPSKKRATEEKAAKVASEKKAAEEKPTEEKDAMVARRKIATEEKAAKVASEKKVAKVASKKKAMEEKAAKVASEKKAAEEKAAKVARVTKIDKGAKFDKITEAKKVKRKSSAYNLFCSHTRGSLAPGLPSTEQSKLLGALWRALGEEEKSEFETVARVVNDRREAAAAAAAA